MAPRISHAHRPLGFKGRVWLALGTVVLGGAGVSAVAFAGTDTPKPAAPRAGHHGPVAPRLFHNTLGALPLTQSSRPTRTLSQRSTDPFNMLGVSWTDPKTVVDGSIEVRTRSMATKTWTAWTTLSRSDSGPDPRSADTTGARGATEPLWTGPSNGVELRISGGSGRLPAGLRLDYIASGDLGGSAGSASPAAQARAATLPDAQLAADSSPAASPSPSDCTSTGTTATMPPTPTSPVRQPAIVDRAQWGADETLRDQTLPCYSTDGVRTMFVHHTADTNDYVCSTDPTNANGSAARVQAEYAYHVKTNGWRDLGYNFLVDKCGTIFEGRWGGLDNGGGEWLPVFGAHTYGWNAGTMGVAVLGTYTDVKASNAVLGALATLADWKLGMYGIKPDSTVQLTAAATQTNYFSKDFTLGTAYPFNAISGHRDGYNTECPGNSLYPQLTDLRHFAAGPAPAPVIKGLTGAVSYSGTWYTSGKVTVSWSEGWYSSLMDHFEVLVDGKTAATVGPTARSAGVTLAAGKHSVTVRAVHLNKTVSTSTAAAVSVHSATSDTDWSRDGKADLLVRTSTGQGYAFLGTTMTYKSSNGTGWQNFNKVVQTDLDRDGLADLIMRGTNGYLYWRHWTGSAWTNTQLATGWGTVRQIVAPGDLTGDHNPDLLTVDSSGVVWVYPGRGNGSFGARFKVGSGLQYLTNLVGHGDFTGDGKVDIVGRTSTGGLYLWSGKGNGYFNGRQTLSTSGFSSANALAATGDVNGDGHADLLIRFTNGYLYMYPGKGTGSFGAKVQMGGTSSFSSYTILG